MTTDQVTNATKHSRYSLKELCNINIFDLEGGLFEETNSVEEIAFKYAVDHINRFDFSSNVDN